MRAAVAVVCGFFGLAIGSFLNVVIYRVPRNLSIVAPPSACPSCHTFIRPRDNVPLLSWMLLRGRCRHCKEPISARYPLVEFTTALLFVGVAWKLGRALDVPAYCAFFAGLLALAIVDLETLKLPRPIVWTHLAFVAVLLTAASAATGSWRDLFVGALCGAAWSAVYLGMFFISPKLIGFGDVRFALALGLALGYLDLAYAGLGFFVSNIVGLLVTIALMAAGKMKRSQPVPYGVFLAIGVTIVFFAGPYLTEMFRPGYWR